MNGSIGRKGGKSRRGWGEDGGAGVGTYFLVAFHLPHVLCQILQREILLLLGRGKEKPRDKEMRKKNNY